MSGPEVAENLGVPMSVVVAFWIAVVVVVASGVVALIARPRKVRYSFEDREDFILLQIEHELASDDAALVTMITLREAVRLKLSSDYKRLLVDVRKLAVEDDAAFWMLIGGLGPVLLSGTLRIAVMCRRKKDTGRRFHQSAIVECFDSERPALAYLRSSEPPRAVILERNWVESLLLPKTRPQAPPLRRTA
jgi:hypothetical protein